MQPGYIVGYTVFFIAMIFIAIFMYPYNVYTKNRIFSKTKISIPILIILSLLLISFLIFGSYFAWHMSTSESDFADKIHVVLSFILVFLCSFYILIYIFITFKNNKNKINYTDITKINWQEKIDNLKHEIGDIIALKQNLLNKHKKYYQQMLSYYETILNNAKNKKIFTNQEIADIITFNDAFTHKWSHFLNNYQLLLTYQFCLIFGKKILQK